MLRGRLTGGSVCTGEEPQWFTAPYRWCLVLEELQTAHHHDPDAGRHPDSASTFAQISSAAIGAHSSR